MIVRKGSPLGDTSFFLALRVQGLDAGGVYDANIDRIVNDQLPGEGQLGMCWKAAGFTEKCKVKCRVLISREHELRRRDLLMERSHTGDDRSYLGEKAVRDLVEYDGLP